MSTTRLEAFSDGVIAIIITIMVLELHPPLTDHLFDLVYMLPKFAAYLFSFIIVAIYWNNHHHLMKATDQITAHVMWANMMLLFWLSLIPFTTAWLGEPGHYLQFGPVLLYSSVSLLCGVSYYLLSKAILSANPHSKLKETIGKDRKGMISLYLYIAAVCLSFFAPVLALACVAVTAILWFIPDKRLEAVFS